MGPPQHPVIAFSDLLKNARCNLFGAFLASSDRVNSTVERTWFFFGFQSPTFWNSTAALPLLAFDLCYFSLCVFFLRVDGWQSLAAVVHIAWVDASISLTLSCHVSHRLVVLLPGEGVITRRGKPVLQPVEGGFFSSWLWEK